VLVNKSDVRNCLRRAGREDDWTEMQGYVYGARMAEAATFPGVKEFLRACRAAGHTASIISHKTRAPFRGEHYDLHRAAIAWLEEQGFFAEADLGLARENVFFELTKEAKLARIATQRCTHFIDDLPEFLAEPGFPANVKRVLFDPNNLYAHDTSLSRITSWAEAQALVIPEKRSV